MKTIALCFCVLLVGSGLSNLVLWVSEQEMSLHLWWSPVSCKLNTGLFLLVMGILLSLYGTRFRKRILRLWGLMCVATFLLFTILMMLAISLGHRP